ncbi:L-lactate permease [Pedosphaera parvula]|uniref:L-lactate permease n=1 Tax=Pedosphaera parvula (strain Ellin514) TaxID=320771 RepID=B9XFH6_PEDPL|nr:L-lactate permease [Pedosphaera parvula]EEF61340.1 L-lactate transport [Pedosphaera parvula Ellin514]
MTWSQQYDPLGNAALSTILAALPVAALLGSIALFKIRIHFAAIGGLLVALAVAILVFHMPVKLAAATTFYGAAYGLFPIGWIILNLIFLYQLTVENGYFTILRSSLATLAPDPRIQVILIAFCFGAFFEGAAGFGTPVAVTAAILIQLGFKPLQASGLSLIANTAPVAFGALGTPVIALSKVTGISELALSAMIGRQLPFFSLLIPFWVVWAFAGFRGMIAIWPAALTAGLAFAIPQFLVSNFHGPWLVDIIASLCAMAAVAILLRFWQPKAIWKHDTQTASDAPTSLPHHGGMVARAWTPWILLTAFVFIWGVPKVKAGLDSLSTPKWEVPALHNAIVRVPPVVVPPTPNKPTMAEPAIFTLNYLSATGTGILVAAIISGFIMGFSFKELIRTYWKTLVRVRYSLVTIAAMLALGYVTRYSGTDVTLGLALAKTGKLYPFFGTLLGWLGVALTGSDTASNVLFGSLQKITAQQTGISPTLMAAANSSGGVMGKMVDAQSIVVASTATNWYGGEGSILRFVFFHSIALAALVGILVFLQAYVLPFCKLVVR